MNKIVFVFFTNAYAILAAYQMLVNVSYDAALIVSNMYLIATILSRQFYDR